MRVLQVWIVLGVNGSSAGVEFRDLSVTMVTNNPRCYGVEARAKGSNPFYITSLFFYSPKTENQSSASGGEGCGFDPICIRSSRLTAINLQRTEIEVMILAKITVMYQCKKTR